MADQQSTTKNCTKCARSLPATGEYFSRRRAGLRAQCRSCYSAARAAYIAANKEKHRQATRRCYERKKAEYRAVNKVWIATHRETVRAKQRRANKRTLSTPKGLLRNRVGPYIRLVLRRRAKGDALPPGVMRWLPYSMEQLATHLEARFLPGMGWHNVREWHVDHIRPIASFAFDAPSDPAFQECWALSNLQPLWAQDNQRKGATVAA